MKKLEDQYLVIKVENVGELALSRLTQYLRDHCFIVADLNELADIESETITVERVGELSRTVTERFYRAPVTENRLETKIEVNGDVDAAMLEAALAAAPPIGKPPHLPCDKAPQGWCCSRERGHIGSCAAYEVWPAGAPPQPQEATAQVPDSVMYAHYLGNNNIDAMLRIEEKHLLVGYSPEHVSIGLKAIEEGKDPIYSINCHIEKDYGVPQPVMPSPFMPAPSIPPAAPQPVKEALCLYAGYPCLSERMPGSDYCPTHTPPKPAQAPMAPPPAAPMAYCGEKGCPVEPVEGEAHCAVHAYGSEAAPQMPVAQAPVKHKSWCGEKGSAVSCICQAEELAFPASEEESAPLDAEPESKRGFCEAEGCEAERRLGSRFCRDHSKRKG